MSTAASIPPFVEEKRDEIEHLCRKYSVTRLELFGSAADGTFDALKSDLDFLVEFEPSTAMNAFHQFFGLQIALADLLHRKVDLVDATSMRNPYFVESVNKNRKLLYAA